MFILYLVYWVLDIRSLALEYLMLRSGGPRNPGIELVHLRRIAGVAVIIEDDIFVKESTIKFVQFIVQLTLVSVRITFTIRISYTDSPARLYWVTVCPYGERT